MTAIGSASGRQLHVRHAPGVVGVVGGPDRRDPSGQLYIDGYTVGPEQACELVQMLDLTLADDAPAGLVGSVTDMRGRAIHVVKHGNYHVTVHDHPNWREDSGYLFVLRDQVQALRDALASAIDAASVQQTA